MQYPYELLGTGDTALEELFLYLARVEKRLSLKARAQLAEPLTCREDARPLCG